MAGDKKGKSKMVVQKNKKRTREDREREQAEAVADAADRQGSLRIRDPQVQGEPQQQLWLGRLPDTRSPNPRNPNPNPKKPNPKNPNTTSGSKSRYPKLFRVNRV